jgi:hypothetical protein
MDARAVGVGLTPIRIAIEKEIQMSEMTDTGHRLRFRGWDCAVFRSTYDSQYGGGLALVLLDADTYERVAVATVNLYPVMPPAGHAFIKDWSENTGMLAALVEAGLVEDTGKREPTGYVVAALVKLLAS